MTTIKRWDTGAVIIEVDVATMREALEYAVKHKTDLSSANLRSANLSSADLRSANLSSADLSSADLSCADLRYANLSSADLRYANLRYANLSSADLRYANLRFANLSSAVGIIPQMQSPLHLLLEQPAAIRCYKLVENDYTGPYNGGIVYKVGEAVEVMDANTDVNESCAAGINVATLDWCLKEWQSGYRILVVEFLKEDIACIPLGTDGKFRLHRCKVVREVDLKKELNWPMEEKEHDRTDNKNES